MNTICVLTVSTRLPLDMSLVVCAGRGLLNNYLRFSASLYKANFPADIELQVNRIYVKNLNIYAKAKAMYYRENS